MTKIATKKLPLTLPTDAETLFLSLMIARESAAYHCGRADALSPDKTKEGSIEDIAGDLAPIFGKEPIDE